ncbi:hypothetical protein QA612_15170 [Evansella sp. AB-P1]|uniref:hypothetical protein n=1 Tax=Evansella sp. AB-P1 TaxID=3037653 RepID=UPI00241C0ADA|nr:hypothetical protein [Evansella sp. AB-P1]MDG5788811.1 hypothetical protein [Evansella sp. AB-P1]
MTRYNSIYEEYGREMSHGYTEQTGLGIITVPLLIGVFPTTIYVYVKAIIKKNRKTITTD